MKLKVKAFFTAAWNFIKRFFTKDWGYKIAAIVVAFLMWSFVITNNNPLREKTFQNIPVKFSAMEQLREKGLASDVPLSEVLTSVSLTAQASASALQYVTEDMFSVTVDLSSINDVGEYELPVKAKTIGTIAKVLRTDPATVKLRIEQQATREVPVEVQINGEQKDWLYYGTPLLSQETVEIKGSRTNVDKVARAVCYVDVADQEEPFKQTIPVTLFDADGMQLDSGIYAGTPSVIVEMQIYPKKTKPIDISTVASTVYGLADGFEVLGVKVEPESAEIAGKLENLDAVNNLYLLPITLDNASSDVVIPADIERPEGVVAVVPNQVTVTLTIGKPQQEQTYDAVAIAVKNLGQNLSVKLSPETVDVTLVGIKEDLEAITADELKPFVDAAGLAAGTYSLPVKFENRPDIKATIKPGIENIEVVIE